MNLFLYKKSSISEEEKKLQLKEEFLDLLKQAKVEWQRSIHLLSEITDSDLMDYVIYSIKANEARYRYLLKIARSENIHGSVWTKENFNDI